MEMQAITIDTIWEAVWCTEGTGITYWAPKIRNAAGNSINIWKRDADRNLVPNPQALRIFDAEAERWHDVSLEMLEKGYRSAVANRERHCGYILDIEDSDECFGDIVIQHAIFGEVIYS
jgi:hypothetical protein